VSTYRQSKGPGKKNRKREEFGDMKGKRAKRERASVSVRKWREKKQNRSK